MAGSADRIEQARKRFSAAKTGWSTVREDLRSDLRFVSGDPTQQWDPEVKSARDDDNVPALTFDRTNPLLSQIVNRARQNRPQPKVVAGDEGDPETADVIESKLRHLQSASHAEVAYDNAVLYAAGGGIGWFRISKDYVTKSGRDQEPKVLRVLDPATVYPDPSVEDPAFADMEWCFVRKKYTREAFKAEFKKEPVSWPFDSKASDDLKDWGDDAEHVYVAEYWWVEKRARKLVWLAPELGGGQFFYEEVAEYVESLPPEMQPAAIVAERPCEERIVHCDIIDGEKVLEENIWTGEWIPLIPVTGREMIVDGKRHFISAVRYLREPQKFLNAAISGVAMALGEASHHEYLGVKGAFKDPKWRDGKRHKYLEYEPVSVNGTPAPAPQRDNAEPPIAALVQALMLASDGMKAAVGYVDNITRPSQADISGAAVTRRTDQANLATYEYQDNLVQAQWHACRVMLDLLLAETDTPRKWSIRKEDGESSVVPVTVQQEDGSYPLVPGMEDKPHYRIDYGEYGLEITTGPSYSSRAEEQVAVLLEVLKVNPALWPAYAPTVFKLMGYPELEAVAELMVPPQVASAKQATQQGLPPQAAAMLAQKDGQIAQLQGALKEVLVKIQTKAVEQQGKVEIENLKFIQEIIVKAIDAEKERAGKVFDHSMTAANKMIDLGMQAAQPPQQPQPGVS